MLVREGFVREFDNGKALGSYAGELVLPLVIVGMIEASTAAIGSAAKSLPILQVPTRWCALLARPTQFVATYNNPSLSRKPGQPHAS